MNDAKLREACQRVLDGFEQGLFVRSMDKPIIRYAIPLAGLAVLQRYVLGIAQEHPATPGEASPPEEERNVMT